MTGPLKPEVRSKIKTLGVISEFPNTLDVNYIGSTIFNNENKEVDISVWNLNKIIKSKLQKDLKSAGITYREVQLDKDRMLEAVKEGQKTKNKLLGHREDKFVYEYFVQAAKEQGVDYVLIFLPSRHDNFPGHAPGFALHCRSFLGSKGNWLAYSIFMANIMDTNKNTYVYGNAITPNDTGIKSDKACAEAGNDKLAFANSFKEDFQKIAVNMTDFVLEDAGIKK